MHFILLSHLAACISILAGLCFLSVDIFMYEWFMKMGLLRKKYSGDDGRIIYAVICLFFIVGGIAVLVSK